MRLLLCVIVWSSLSFLSLGGQNPFAGRNVPAGRPQQLGNVPAGRPQQQLGLKKVIPPPPPPPSPNRHLPGYNATEEERRQLISNDFLAVLNAMMPRRLEETLQNNTNYINRLPFPHMAQDSVFPVELLRKVAEEIPDNPATTNGCVNSAPRCDKDNLQFNKNAFQKTDQFGPHLRAMMQYLKSGPWIQFLEKLTGIKGIITDPRHAGAGIHQITKGGFLKIHADFNRLHGMHRRVNVLLYLNEDWKEEYGGHLELWSNKDKFNGGADKCMVRKLPSLGQLAIFSSTDFSYHGHPEALTSPTDRSRRSIALYYYTHDRPKTECLQENCFSEHMTLFQETPCNCMDPNCANFITQR